MQRKMGSTRAKDELSVSARTESFVSERFLQLQNFQLSPDVALSIRMPDTRILQVANLKDGLLHCAEYLNARAREFATESNDLDLGSYNYEVVNIN